MNKPVKLGGLAAIILATAANSGCIGTSLKMLAVTSRGDPQAAAATYAFGDYLERKEIAEDGRTVVVINTGNGGGSNEPSQRQEQSDRKWYDGDWGEGRHYRGYTNLDGKPDGEGTLTFPIMGMNTRKPTGKIGEFKGNFRNGNIYDGVYAVDGKPFWIYKDGKHGGIIDYTKETEKIKQEQNSYLMKAFTKSDWKDTNGDGKIDWDEVPHRNIFTLEEKAHIEVVRTDGNMSNHNYVFKLNYRKSGRSEETKLRSNAVEINPIEGEELDYTFFEDGKPVASGNLKFVKP